MKLSSVPILACAFVLGVSGCSDPEEDDGFGYDTGATGGSQMGMIDLGSGGSSGGTPSGGSGGTSASGGTGASSTGGVGASGGTQSSGGASTEECAALEAAMNAAADELQRCDPTKPDQCQVLFDEESAGGGVCGCYLKATAPSEQVQQDYRDAYLRHWTTCFEGVFCLCGEFPAGECVETPTGAFCDR